jgi:hypothetical protein
MLEMMRQLTSYQSINPLLSINQPSSHLIPVGADEPYLVLTPLVLLLLLNTGDDAPTN